MALTKVYQIGEIMFVEIAGNPDRIKFRAWSVDSNELNVYIKDLVPDETPPDLVIPIADVRDGVNAAIGGQTRVEVENWCAYPVA